MPTPEPIDSIPELVVALEVADAIVTYMGPTSRDNRTGKGNRWAVKIQGRLGGERLPHDFTIRGRGDSLPEAVGDAVAQITAWVLTNLKEAHE